MMKKNVCLSSAHPLVAAVDKNLINTAILSQYNSSLSRKESLNVVTFTNAESPPVAILNGWLQVLATRVAFQALSSQQEKLQVHINELQEYFNDLEDQVTTPSDHRMKAKLDQAKGDHKNIQQTLKNIQLWLVYFYDEGLITSSWGLRLSDPSAAPLWSLPQETRHFPGPKNDEEFLLHFLSENAEEQSWPKLPDERLAEILFRNLYKPQPVEKWSDLISNNWILEQTCH